MNNILVDMQFFDLAGKGISCIVTVFMVFQYFDTKYARTLNSNLIYIGWKILCCLLNFTVYLLDSPFWNISFWILIVFISSKLFYCDIMTKKSQYYIVNFAFVLVLSTCEAAGGLLVDVAIQSLKINQNSSIISFSYVISSSLSEILLYYLVLKRFFINQRRKQISLGQYAIYALITAYVLINIGEILFLMKHELDNKDYLFLLVDAFFIIFINLYLFHLLDAFAENRSLKFRLALYEQQAQNNYEYYRKQEEKNRAVLAVMHDIKKYMQVVDGLEKSGEFQKRQEVVESVENMIAPLLMRQYCRNAILNVILNDKKEYCDKNGISFMIDVHDVDIEFMKSIDITTLFGNLLDNAIEACEKAEEKQVDFKIYPFHNFIYIQLINTYVNEVKWDARGRPLSMKGEHHGIGLENVDEVLKNYNGSIQFSIKNQKFTVEIMVNRP